MTTITPTTDPAVPPGSEPDMWTGNQRDVYSQIGYIPTGPDLLTCPTVTVVAEQYRDGSLGCIDVILDVAMGRSDAGLSLSQAVELAALLLAAADVAGRWAAE